jgi:mannitol-specific phosphotransferase system IIBC component
MLQEDLIEFRGNLIKARMDYGKDFKQVRQTAISSLRKEIQAVLGRDDLAQRVEVKKTPKILVTVSIVTT